VTDADGLTDTATHSITTTEGAYWHVNVALEVGAESEVTSLYARSALAEVNGNPAMTFNVKQTGSPLPDQAYIRASDPLGSSWGELRILGEGDSATDFDLEERDKHLAVLDGRPAVFYVEGGQAYDRAICNALDVNGTEWAMPEFIQAGDIIGKIVSWDGYTAAAFGERTWNKPFIYSAESVDLAQDDLGTSWQDSGLSFEYDMFDCDLGIIGDRLAAAFIKDGDVMYVRSPSEDATIWPDTPTVVEENGYDKTSTVLWNAGGFPAIAYHDLLLDRVVYVRAANPEGSDWNEGRVLDSLMTGRLLASKHDGRPVLIYQLAAGGFMFISANDESGDSWGLPMYVTHGTPEDELFYPDYLMEINGNPSFCSVHAGAVHANSPHVDYVSYY
jgi:hypothetical protein